MSEIKQISKKGHKPEFEQDIKDTFGTYKQNIEKYYDYIDGSTPRYLQAFAELQEEILLSYEHSVKTALAIQKEIAIKTGIYIKLPGNSTDTITHTTDYIIKARSMRDQITLTTIEAAKQNIQTWNKNAMVFADVGRNLVRSWMGMFEKSVRSNSK